MNNNNNKMNKTNYFLVLDDSDNEADEEKGSSIVPLVIPTDNATNGTSFVQSSDVPGQSKKRKNKKIKI
jgi:hypothetical protein